MQNPIKPRTGVLSGGFQLPDVLGQDHTVYMPTSRPDAGPAMGSQQPERRELPKGPPKRSTDPWAHENRRQTLLNLGAAFLSSNSFGEGLGRAASGLSDRMDRLKAEAEPDRQFGVGPGGQFEVITDPATGERTIRRIEEFQDVVEEDRAYLRQSEIDKANHMTPAEAAEQRSQVMNSILQLPEEQRPGAYAQVMQNPAAYGLPDTNGMPGAWDPTYGNTMAGSGLTVSQQRSAQRQADAFTHRQRVDAQRLSQGERRLNKPPPSARSSAKLPTGFILD